MPSLSASMAADLSPEALEIQALKNAGQPIPQYLYDIVNAQNGVQSRLVVPEDGSRQGGDTIASATVIGSLPYSDTGTTVGYVNDYDSVCPYSGSTSGDVVYSYAPGSTQTLNIDLCNSAYDTKVYVFENTAGNVIACNDDFYFGAPCFTYTSALEAVAVTPGNTYYIVVDGYGSANGAYQLDVTALDCSEISCTGTDENEAGGNDGPNEVPALFGEIACGETVCGTTFTLFDGANDTRDLDWFEMQVGGSGGIVTVNLNVESFNGILYFVDGDEFNVLYSADLNGFCADETLVTDCLPAGNYYVVVGHNSYTGVEIPADYGLSVSCEACTFENPCDAFVAAVSVIPTFPFASSGSTVGAPDIFGINNGAVGYEFTLTETSTVTFSSCQPGTNFDTDTYVFSVGGPCNGGTQLFYNDGNSSCIHAAWASEWTQDCILDAGTYMLVLTGYNYGTPTEGSFTFFMDATSCACEPTFCVGTPEDEAGGNNGPNEEPILYGEISCVETVCGTTFTYFDGVNNTRDLDWFHFPVYGESSIVTMDLFVNDFNGILYFVASDAYTIIAMADQGGFCVDETLTLSCLPAGDYYVVAGHNSFTGVPIPADYGLAVSCEPCSTVNPCDSSIPLACGDYQIGSTTGWTNYLGNPAPDAFFELQVPDAGVVTLSTCGWPTDFPTVLRLFDGCPFTGGVQLALSEWECGDRARLTSFLDPGTYWVVLEGTGFTDGNYGLEVSCQNGPYTIPEAHALAPSLLYQTITLDAFTTDDQSGLLVADLDRYEQDRPLPLDHYVFIPPGVIQPEDMGGAHILATGQLVPEALTGTELRLNIVSYQVLLAPVPLVPWTPINWNIPTDCDTCKVGVLISGGVDAANNHPRYWNNLVDVFCLKRSEGYCADRLTVLYYKGTGRDNQLPAARVDTCTAAKIKAALVQAAAQMARCKRGGKSPKLEVFITNHGDTLAGGQTITNLLGSNHLHPDSLTAWIQMAVDSGAADLELEAVQCFGGGVVNSLARRLARLDSCRVTAASSADSTHVAKSRRDPGGYSLWGRAWALARRDSLSLQQAIRRANEIYDQILQSYNLNAEVGRSQYFRSIPTTERCDSMLVQVTPGGYIEIEFEGDHRNCGNVTVYGQRKSDNKYVKLKNWNWNIPGSTLYHEGYNKRRIDADTSGTGMFIIHNDNGPFRIKVRSHNPLHAGPQPNRLTSPSNREEYAGFNMGWRNDSPGEYSPIVAGNLVIQEQDGMSLGDLPAVFGNAGVGSLQVNFDVPMQNPWWEDMALGLEVLSVSGNPQLTFTVPGAEQPVQVLAVDVPGEYLLPVGAVPGTGAHSLTIAVSGGSFVPDCWDFHTLLSTWPLLDVELTILQAGSDVLLSWTASPAATSYRVESAAFAGAPWTTLGNTAATSWLDEDAISIHGLRIYRVIAVE